MLKLLLHDHNDLKESNEYSDFKESNEISEIKETKEIREILELQQLLVYEVQLLEQLEHLLML